VKKHIASDECVNINNQFIAKLLNIWVLFVRFKLVVAYVVSHDLRIANAYQTLEMPHRTLVDRNMQLINTAIAILLASSDFLVNLALVDVDVDVVLRNRTSRYYCLLYLI